MSRCLGERTLWRLSEGEGSDAERAHATSCLICAGQLRRLEQDLRHLRSALAGPPPPRQALVHTRPVHRRWSAAAAALAAIVVLAWFGVWWQRFPPPASLDTGEESVWSVLEGMRIALFPSLESGFTAIPDQLSDLDDLQAALTGEWPCEDPATFVYGDCDNDDTWALLLGEP
jgi:hypothetical protein